MAKDITRSLELSNYAEASRKGQTPLQNLISFSTIDLCIVLLACVVFNVFFFLFCTQGISCILVLINHWVLKTWFGKWFVTVCFAI